jgi:hypothetical protein
VFFSGLIFRFQFLIQHVIADISRLCEHLPREARRTEIPVFIVHFSFSPFTVRVGNNAEFYTEKTPCGKTENFSENTRKGFLREQPTGRSETNRHTLKDF